MERLGRKANLIDSDSTVVRLWNRVALDAIREERPEPTVISRALHILHAAIYDTWSIASQKGKPAYSKIKNKQLEQSIDVIDAINTAAHHCLKTLFPEQEYRFDRFLKSQNSSNAGSPSSEFGKDVATQILAIRSKDGSFAEFDYKRDYFDREKNEINEYNSLSPNEWSPLKIPNGAARDAYDNPTITENKATYIWQKPVTPHWPSIESFALKKPDQFRPVAPPKLGQHGQYIDAKGETTTEDKAYREQLRQLVHISGSLNTRQKAKAEYWADGPRTTTPVGHWNEIAQDLAQRDVLSLEDDVKLFFLLNNALFDTGISVWDAKYHYNFIRPQQAIRNLYEGKEIKAWTGANNDQVSIKGEYWQPYQDPTFITPAFPEYTSGHSAFSYASASILSRYLGSDQYYDGKNYSVYDSNNDSKKDLIGEWKTNWLKYEDQPVNVTLRWPTLWDAAAEAGHSRLLGGIHIQDSDLRGREMGLSNAKQTWQKSKKLFVASEKNLKPYIIDKTKTNYKINNYSPGSRKYIFTGFDNLTSLKDLNIEKLHDSITLSTPEKTSVEFNIEDVRKWRKKDVKFRSRDLQIKAFEAIDKKTKTPVAERTKINSLHLKARIITSNPLKSLVLDVAGNSQKASIDLLKKAKKINSGYEILIDEDQINKSKELTIKDGNYQFNLSAADKNSKVNTTLAVIYDKSEPRINGIENAMSKKNILTTTPTHLTIKFNEPIQFDPTKHKFRIKGSNKKNKPIISSVSQPLPGALDINFSEALRNGKYKIDFDKIKDIAGNTLKQKNLPLIVDALAKVKSITPFDNETNVIINRPIKIEFDQPIKPKTINKKSIQLTSGEENIPIKYSVSGNHEFVTLYPNSSFPSSTRINLQINGDKIRTQQSRKIDANSDGQKGGTLKTSFSTLSSSRIEGTNIEGYIFDANYTDKLGLDIPLQGVKVSVVGQEEIKTKTDKKGRFLLKNLPIPIAYLDFDASKVKNRNNINYGTIVKPVDTEAGKTTGLGSKVKPFNIYFSALAKADTVKLKPTKFTEVKIGEKGLENLKEVLPNIGTKEWKQLKVIIPPNSLKTDQGQPVKEVSIMAFPPERIPAPVPPGMDPDYVFTVKAESATVVEGNAQVEFPNVENLKPGEKTFIMTFDHDDGQWKETGTAVVSPDGKKLVTEGSTGVNTLGWKFLGKRNRRPLFPPRRRRPDEDDDECPSASESEGNTDTEKTTYKHQKNGLIIGDGSPLDTLYQEFVNPYTSNDANTNLPPSTCQGNQNDVDPWDVDYEIMVTIDPVIWEFMNVRSSGFTINPNKHLHREMLLEGEDALTLEIEPKKIDEMFLGGYQGLDKNTYYSGVIEIEKSTYYPDRPTKTEIEKFTLHRLVNATDLTHDDTLNFLPSTPSDGSLQSIQDLPLRIRNGSHTINWEYEDSNDNLITIHDFYEPNTLYLIQETRQKHLKDDGSQNKITSILKLKEEIPLQPGVTEIKSTDIPLVSNIVPRQKLRIQSADFTSTMQKILADPNTLTTNEKISWPAQLASEVKFLPNGDPDWDIFEENKRTKINRIKSKNYYTDAATIGKILDRVKQLFAERDIIVDVGLGNDPKAVNIKFKSSELDENYKWKRVAGRAVGALKPNDIDVSKILNINNSFNNYMKMHEALQHINKKKDGQINIILSTMLDFTVLNNKGKAKKIYRAFPDPEQRFIEVMAYAFVHEMGHHLGMPHPFSNAGVLDQNWTNDPMNYPKYMTSWPPKFSEDYGSFGRIATRSSIAPYDLTSVLRILNVGGKNNFVDQNIFSDFLFEDDGDEDEIEFKPTVPHHLVALTRNNQFVDPIFHVTDVIGGPKFKEIKFKLINLGSQSIKRVALLNEFDASDFQVEIDKFKTFDPLDSVNIKLKLTNDIIENSKKMLTFETDLNYQYNLLIDFNVKYIKPKISLIHPIRNFGGVAFDKPDVSTQSLEIKNQGDKPLKIFKMSIDNTNQFSIHTNLQDNFIIPPHSSQQILVEFKPDSPGLHHGTLSIQSNDSKDKMLKLPLNGTGYSSSFDYDWGNDYIYLNSNNFLNRQVSDDQGFYDLFVPSDSDYTFKIFDPKSGLVAVSDGKAQLNSQFSSRGPSLSFAPSVTLDTDGDGLTDEIEEIIGSSSTRVDSNNDGLSDYDAVGLGLNPLDGFSSTTGIISSTQISGLPVDFVVTNPYSAESSLLAFVATENDGLHIIDYQEVDQPIKVSQLTINDSLTTIEFFTHTEHVAIGGKKGLHVVDVSNPFEAVLEASHSFDDPIVAMVKLSELLVVATKSSLMVINPQTGSILAEDSTLTSISSIAVQGNNIYAVKNQNQLLSLKFVDSELSLQDSVSFPKATIRSKPAAKKVFVVNEVAYISNGLEIENVPKFRESERGGFLTYNVADPKNLLLISDIDTPPILSGNLETVSDGSGTVLVAGGIAGVEVHDGKDTSNTYDLQATYDVEGRALSAQLAGSYGFVSTSASQLLALNLLGPDFNGAEPDIELDWDSLDQDLSTPGIQTEEGSVLNLSPLVKDDHQIKYVSLYLDNEIHEVDIVPPYDFRIKAPEFSKEKQQFQLAISATDTGLNVSKKHFSTLQITPDKTSPKVLNQSFGNRLVVLAEPTLLEINFSESIATNSLKKNFVTFIQENGSKDGELSKVTHRWDLDNSLLSIILPSLKKGTHNLSIELSSIKDHFGNELQEYDQTVDVISISPTIEWTARNEASWNDLNNWSEKRIPQTNDIVAIESRKHKERANVSLSNGDHTFKSLYLNGNLTFSNAHRSSDENFQNITLSPGDFYLHDGRFKQYKNTTLNADRIFASKRSDVRIFSGIVKNTEFNNESPIGFHPFQSCVVFCAPSLVEKLDTQLHDVTFNGHVDFAPDSEQILGNVGLTVFDGLTVNDKLVFSPVGEDFARFGFWGEQKVSGSGEIILSMGQSSFDSYADNRLVLIPQVVDVDEALTFDRSVTIRGSGFIGVNTSKISGGHVAISGEVVAEMGDLILETIDNSGDNLLLNPISGDIWLSESLRNATLKYGSYAEDLDKIVNRIHLGDLDDGPGTPSSRPIKVTSIQAGVDLLTEQSLDIRDDFELNKTLTLQAGGSFRPRVSLTNITEITGRGVIQLLAPNEDAESRYQNDLYDIRFSDLDKELSEVLTFGEDLKFIGTGRISVESLLGKTDYLRILGSITASQGVLEIESLDNGDHPITLSHADGGIVYFEDAIKNAHLISSDGSISEVNPIRFTDSVLVDNVVLDVDAISSEYSIDIVNNFELNSTLSLVPEKFSSSRLNIIGPNVLSGTGTILLSSPDVTAQNQDARYSVRFESISDLAETFTIPSEFEIRGTGRIETSFGYGQNRDKINLVGTLTADGGLLEIRSLDPVIGSLHATADGLLDVRGDLELTSTSSIHLILDDPDGLINQPKINVSGSALLGGGLVLQFTDAYQPVLGDQFLIAASSDHIADDFDSINVIGLSEGLDVSVSSVGQSLVASIISS